jgi:hypothetical protein
MLRFQIVRVLAMLGGLGVATLPSIGAAQAPLLTGLGGPRDFGTDCLSPNDDGSSALIDLTPAFPGGLQFFGRRHTSTYVNTNGNITFSDSLGTYTPDPFPVADQPMIAPYWADVDIRGAECSGFGGDLGCMDPMENGVWWHLEPGMMVVTWNDVGYFACHDEKKMNFQLILTAAEGGCGLGGDFDVEFRFNRCEWHTGDASGGADGFCDPTGGGFCESTFDDCASAADCPAGDTCYGACTPGQSGFDAGNLTDFVELMGSRTESIHTIMCTMSNVGEPGVWRFRIRSGSVICPEAGDTCDTGLMGACAEGLMQCVGGGTECVSVVGESAERCDNVDNDCDGMVDDGDGLCGELSVCERGVCTPLCFEGGCTEGQVCNAAGRCVDPGCDGVVCDVGQRCVGGECVGACEGIVCPEPYGCRAGQCVDVCGEITCDECSVCEGGSCVPRCPDVACASGEECLPDGHCVETSCRGVSCPAGQVCSGGTCQDACVGAVCPPQQECRMGECVPMALPGADGGVGVDGGPVMDGGPPPADGGVICPIGMDCTGGRDEGCGCAIPGAGGSDVPLGLAMLGIGLVGLAARRRRR